MILKKMLGTTKSSAIWIFIGGCVWFFLAAWWLGMPIFELLKFIAFQILAVAAPGFALCKLLRLRQTPLVSLVTSYALGLCSLIALYFLFVPLGLSSYVPYAVAALSAMSIAVLFFKRRHHLSEAPDCGELGIALIFCALAAALTFILLSCTYLNPALSGAHYYFHDTINGVATTTSAANSFPMTFLQMSGTYYPYHIFFFCYNAVMKLCLNINSFDITTKLSLITIVPMIAAATVALAKRVTHSNLWTALAAAFVLLIPMPGYLHFLYIDTIGYPLGLGFGILALLFFIIGEETDCKVLSRYHVLSAVFLVGCVGAKGPIAVAFVFGICFALLLRFVRTRMLSIIPRGLLYAVLFFSSYLLLYGGAADNSMSFLPLKQALGTSFSQNIYGTVPDFLFKLLSAMHYSIMLSPLIFAAFLAALIFLFAHIKKSTALVDFFVGAALAGYVLINMFQQMGSSEQYFLTASYPVAVILLVFCAKSAFDSKNKYCKITAGLAVCASFLFFGYLHVPAAVGSVWGGNSGPYNSGLCGAARYSRFSDKRMLTEADIAADPKVYELRGIVTSSLEYESLIWLRDNTPADSVIADGHYILNNKYFCGSAFSERSYYLEGWGFVTMEDSNKNTAEKVRRDAYLRFFFQGEDEGYLLLMAREGCDYVVISQIVNPGLYLSDKYCDEVFKNSEVAIYKLHEFIPF
ncbi:MAG: hypothetical protein RSE36_00190 [Oscillospiraceae bacterium]